MRVRDKWPPHLPTPTNILIVEYLECDNPVSRSVLRDIIVKREIEAQRKEREREVLMKRMRDFLDAQEED